MPFRVKNANYNALRKLSLRERMAIASDQSMGKIVMQMLSPSQIAELFPKYWIERNPNIDGFMKAMPSSLSATRQREYENQIINTATGSAAGANFEAGGYRRKWQQQMDVERQRSQVSRRTGPAPTPQLSPEQRAAFEALKSGDIGVNDPRMKWLLPVAAKDLASSGITRVKDNTGVERFHYAAPEVSEEQVKQSMASGGSMKQIIDRSAAKAGIDPRIMYGIVHGESEGKRTGVYDIGDNGKSFGPFQMFMGGGLGNDFQAATGLDPRNSSTLPQQADWIAKEISKRGGGAAARKWVASQWYGYGTQQLGVPGTKQNIEQRASIGDANWNPSWFNKGIYTNMKGSADPIAQNYSRQQMDAQKRELMSQIESGRITSLAQITQPEMRAAARELNINTSGDMKQVKAQYERSGPGGEWYKSSYKELSGSATHRECADLTKAFNPNVGPASGWRIQRNDAAIKPGVAVATQMYNKGTGGAHGQAYHTGIALSSPDSKGDFLIFEQANGYKPRVHTVNVNEYNYGNGDRRPGNFWGPISGKENQQSIEALKVAYQLADDDQKAKIQAALGGISDTNVVTSPPGKVDAVVTGYSNSEQLATVAGVGLSEQAQIERKAVVQGSLMFEGGGVYHFGSGRPDDPNFPSTPLGSSEVGALNPHHVPGGVGYEMPALQGWDPKVGRNRSGMVIHSSGHDDLEQLYSHGCISIPKSEFGAFEAEMEAFKKAHGGKAYINVMPDGRVTVTAAPAYDKGGNPIAPVTTEQAIKDIQTNQPQVVQQAPQVISGDVQPMPMPQVDFIQPMESVTQPNGPTNAAGPVVSQPTPASAPSAAPAPTVEPTKPAALKPERYNVNVSQFTAAIRNTQEFKDQAGMFGSMVPDSTIINGFNEDPRVKAAGIHLDEKGIMHFKQGQNEEVKKMMQDFNAKSFMTKIEDTKPATTVKAMAEGGSVSVNTDQIAAYPIGGLRGDNAVVVNANQKPLFTMNTNEDVLMDPNNSRAHVLPENKNMSVGPAPKQDMTSGIMEEFQSTINDIRRDFANLTPKKMEQPNTNPANALINDPMWLSKINLESSSVFKNPTARRVAERAGGKETGDASSGFHFSRGNNS